MKVSNLTSPRSGCEVANQFIIIDNNVTYFQSYRSIIAKREMVDGKFQITLDSFYWNYSVTTSKYRNQFLGESTAETQAKINSGEYKLADLN